MIEISGTPKTISKKEIVSVALICFEKFNIPKDTILEVIFTNSAKIKELNFKFRQIDKATDVLSFSQVDIKSNEQPILGSIVICEEVAKEYNEEVSDLIRHGFLHLVGFDHEINEKDWNKELKRIQDSVI